MNPSKDDDPVLTEIERGLLHDDPRLATHLENLNRRLAAREPPLNRRRRLVAWLCALLVVVVIVAAMAVRATERSSPPSPPPINPAPGISVPVGPGAQEGP